MTATLALTLCIVFGTSAVSPAPVLAASMAAKPLPKAKKKAGSEKKAKPKKKAEPKKTTMGPVMGLVGARATPPDGESGEPGKGSETAKSRKGTKSAASGDLPQGRLLRILGIGFMAGGGAAAVAGTGVLVAYTIKFNDFDDKLTQDLAEQDDRGCPLGSNTGRCGELERNIADWREGKVSADKGKQAGIITLGIGAGVLVTGGIIYAVGKYYRKNPKTARVQIVPTPFGLMGRF